MKKQANTSGVAIENIKKLNDRKPEYVINNETTEQIENKEPNIINESMQITQGKLVIDRKSTRLNSSHITPSRMPSSA